MRYVVFGLILDAEVKPLLLQSFLTDPFKGCMGEGRLTEDSVFYMRQRTCRHEKAQLYTQRRFDILNGLEFTFTRCINCHKIVALESRKFTKH